VGISRTLTKSRMLLDVVSNLQSYKYFLYILLSLPLLLWVREKYKVFRYHRKCRQHGVAPVKIDNDGLLGFSRLFAKLDDAKNHRTMEGFEDDIRRMGRTYNMKSAMGDVVVTTQPENAKFILSSNHNDFSLGIRSDQLATFIGNGIFTQNGHNWKHSRSLLKPQFARSQITDTRFFEKNADNLVDAMKEQHGSVFDVMHYFQCMTLDFAVEFLTGERLGCMLGNNLPLNNDHNNPTPGDLQNALGYASEFVIKRAIAVGFYWLFTSERFNKSVMVAQRFFDVFVQKARMATSRPEPQDKADKERFIFINELSKQVQDDADLRNQCMNVLLAGRDTTASSLSLCFHFLSRNPDIYKRLRNEIREVYGDSKDGLNSDNLRSCKYLKAVVNETLRVAATVPFNLRSPEKDVILPTGGGPDGNEPTLVEKGTHILILTYALHRDEGYWGQDAKMFNPERWMESSQPAADPWCFLPFSGGPRICIGQQLALNEIYYTIARVCQSFSTIGTPQEEKSKELQFNAGVALFPYGGVPVYANE
jgi:cytochrome P450